MVDGFKLTAKEIKRYLKVSVYMPKDYYDNKDINYNLLITFNGELFFKFINEDNKKFDLNELLESNNINMIVVGIHSPERIDWQKSEFNPYYKGNINTVDTSYSYNFFEYVTYELIPILKQKYRINDNIYLMGFKDSAICAFSMLYAYKEYKGALLFNPNLCECNSSLYEDFNKRFDNNKRLYLYQGELNINNIEGDLFYDFQSTLEHFKISYFVLDYDLNADNSYEAFKDHLINALTIIK